MDELWEGDKPDGRSTAQGTHAEGFAHTAPRFTPLESPGIYAGDGINRKCQLLIEDGVKALPFLTGFTLYRSQR